MKNRFIILFAVLICSTVSWGFINDDDPLTTLLKKLEKYRENYNPEKVHIHTDKPYYSIGDTIWFKSYVVTGETNQLSDLSKILYVELINEKDSVKKSLRLPVVTGLSWGDFTLSDSLSEGNYRIRAYTNWMRNFDENYFFDKTIKIGNSYSSQILTNVTYAYSKSGIKENVEATIFYTDYDKQPIANKPVTYDIQLDNRNILKGQGITDNTGKLIVKFTNAQPFVLKSGRINTLIKLDEKKAVSKTFPIKATSNESTVQFFPESGNLVNNIPTRVAFKAVGADGLSRKVTGYVTDNTANKVAELKSEYAGMGSFIMVPLSNSIYTAIVKFEDGSEKKIELPRSVDKGAIVKIAGAESDQLTVKVLSDDESASTGFTLIAQSNGVVNHISKSKPGVNALTTSLSKKLFPGGIVQFTLFNSSMQPLAERVVFIRHQNALNVDIKTEKEVYKPREKVKMDFNSIDSAGKAISGAFSLAVTNESQVPFDDVNETTIYSNLLLSSELKGFIETPNYYFTDVSPEKDKALDNLMLTQGWRKFEWKNILTGRFPALAFEQEKQIHISGKVSTLNNKPVVGGKVTLISASSGIILDTLTDANGRFAFKNLVIAENTLFLVQAKTVQDKKNVEIEIDRLPQQQVTKNRNGASVELNINPSLQSYLSTRSVEFDLMRKNGTITRNIVLAEVKISQSKPKVSSSSRNLNGPGNADAILTEADLLNCYNIVFCLQGRVSGLLVENGVAYLARNVSFSGRIPMLVFVDGMEQDLASIIPSDVQSIEVLKTAGHTAMYGMRGGGGVLIITTKTGKAGPASRKMSAGMASFAPQGYYISKQFYSPTYGNPSENQLPDLRSTIFWAPSLVTDLDGKASVEFFTADKPGTYKAVIEGLDINGSVTRQVYRFNVK